MQKERERPFEKWEFWISMREWESVPVTYRYGSILHHLVCQFHLFFCTWFTGKVDFPTDSLLYGTWYLSRSRIRYLERFQRPRLFFPFFFLLLLEDYIYHIYFIPSEVVTRFSLHPPPSQKRPCIFQKIKLFHEKWSDKILNLCFGHL